MDIDVKDPKFLRWAAAVLVVVVVVPMYFLTDSYPFTYKARNVQITELDARHQQLSRDLERARLLVRNLEKVEQEYAILHDQWMVAQTLLPEQNQMPDLLRKNVAEAYRVYQRLDRAPLSLFVNDWRQVERYAAALPAGRCTPD